MASIQNYFQLTFNPEQSEEFVFLRLDLTDLSYDDYLAGFRLAEEITPFLIGKSLKILEMGALIW